MVRVVNDQKRAEIFATPDMGVLDKMCREMVEFVSPNRWQGIAEELYPRCTAYGVRV